MYLNRFSFDIQESSRRLRELREARHITRETLSTAIGVSTQIIKNYELAGSNPDASRADAYAGMRIDTLCALSDYFGVSVEYLLGKTDLNNSSNDEKVKLISEFTGLSSEAAQKLHTALMYKNDETSKFAEAMLYPNLLQSINLLLTDVIGCELLSIIYMYLHSKVAGFVDPYNDKQEQVFTTDSILMKTEDQKGSNDYYLINNENMQAIIMNEIQSHLISLQRGTNT